MAERHLLDYKRVLIVDDEPDVLDVLEALLPMCDVVKATTFREAKELLETQYFDVTILDIMGVDGYKLLEIARGRNVIAVMLTAHAMRPDSIVKSYEEGAASFVPKDEINNIVTFLEDILEGIEKGKPVWWRWFTRLGGFLDRKFGPRWQEDDQEFWEKLKSLDHGI
ncbi:MAG: response regulator [Deltaproteobacteria bacterium]|nr:response regulator [Deltaproteobacteria bacterium]